MAEPPDSDTDRSEAHPVPLHSQEQRAQQEQQDTPGTMEARSRLRADGAPDGARAGREYLLFRCGGVPCAAAVAELGEVLPALPHATPLPFSPRWLHGVFLLHNDLVGLVDPMPRLLGPAASGTGAGEADQSTEAGGRPATALIVGNQDALLGLVVAEVAEIALLRAEEIRNVAGPDAPRVAEPYAAGYYLPADGGQVRALVNISRLATDLVQALTEGAGDE